MAAGRSNLMTLAAPPPVDIEELEERVEGLIPRPPDHTGNGGHNGHNGHGTGPDGEGPGGPAEPEDEPYRPPTKSRRSIWPFLLDLGIVMMLFGWIIIGQFLVVIGAVIFVVALTGWIREARAEFSSLRE
jgi:hypothetical protein